MAVTPIVYGLALKSLMEGRFDLRTDKLKAMLVSKSYVPNYNSHQWKTSVRGEIVGSGYEAGGKLLTGTDVISYSNKRLTVGAGNLVWPAITANGLRYIVVYNDSYESESLKPLLLYIDLGQAYNLDGQSFYYNFPSNVLFQQVIP